MGQQTLAATYVWKSGRNHLKFRLPWIKKGDPLSRQPTLLGLNGLTRLQTRHSGTNIDRVHVLGTLQALQKRRR